MEDAITMARLISELGVLVVIAAVFIIIVILEWKSKNKEDSLNNDNYKKLIEEIQSQNNDLVQKLIENNKKPTITPEQYNTRSKVAKEINDSLERAREKSNATRVYLAQYHNGGHNLVNQSFLKMDITNEKVKLGIAPIQSEFKDQYKELFSYWCNKLESDGICFINDVEELKHLDNSMYSFFTRRNITSAFGISINDSEGYPIGFIGMEFMKDDIYDMKQIQHCLQDKKIKVETLLSLN